MKSNTIALDEIETIDMAGDSSMEQLVVARYESYKINLKKSVAIEV